MSSEIIIADEIKNKIFTIRGVQVMLDFHLASIYQVETRRLNEQVKRNKERFPDRFMFQLSNAEWNNLKSQFAISSWGGIRKLPNVFTEQGIAMLASVLKSESAIDTSIMIIDAFVAMRKFMIENASVFQRLDRIELKLLESENKFDKIFKVIDSNKLTPTQGIFFDGQIFDAYKFVSDLIRSAKQSITLIDNYINETTLSILAKKEKDVKVRILTKIITKDIAKDIEKANEQYGNFEINEFSKSHDRFLIIDNAEVYHIGASLKDLGKKWFGFSKMDRDSVDSISLSISEMFK